MHINKKPNEIHENLIPTKFTVQYIYSYTTTINTPYNWPAFLTASCLDIGYVYSCELIRIRKGHIATYTMLL